MPDEKRHELTPEELEAEAAQELPDREEMSLVNANVAAPINLAAALNVASDNSVAYANTQQTANPAQASQPAVDASHLGSQATSGALGSATASPQPYQPSPTSTAQS